MKSSQNEAFIFLKDAEYIPQETENSVISTQYFDAVVSPLAHKKPCSDHTQVFSFYAGSKRVLDIFLSVIFLLLAFPLLLLLAMLVKLYSPGPILFKQKRLGKDGKVFLCYKFRTMIADAEELLKRCPDLQLQFSEGFKIKNDPRITPLGRFMRRTSLDELPQFFNVLRGDISLIGPRPIVPAELEKYGIYQEKLLSVKPGLSGLWQAYGRSNTSYNQRVSMDMLYIDSRTMWLDIRLLFATVRAVLARHGAY